MLMQLAYSWLFLPNFCFYIWHIFEIFQVVEKFKFSLPNYKFSIWYDKKSYFLIISLGIPSGPKSHFFLNFLELDMIYCSVPALNIQDLPTFRVSVQILSLIGSVSLIYTPRRYLKMIAK